ncbi:hypothetical protein [Dactylosporangium sp. NPDC048998]|uniref:hypothetical protein n=1 Tax=Dactylosporangium sp. NPDC048998 TaxID=3363976 RepID=UPI0037144A69
MKILSRKPFVRIGVALASLVAATGLAALPASPAAAGGCYVATIYSFDGNNQAQADTCPGNGAHLWTWVYNGSWDGRKAVLVVTMRYSWGGQYDVYLGADSDGSSNSASYWSDYGVKMQLCTSWWDNSDWRCSQWLYL